MYSINDIVTMLETTTFPEELKQKMNTSYLNSGSYFFSETLDMVKAKIAGEHDTKYNATQTEPNLIDGVITYIHKRITNLKTRIPAQHQNNTDVLRYIAHFIVQDAITISEKTGLNHHEFTTFFRDALLEPEIYVKNINKLIEDEHEIEFGQHLYFASLKIRETKTVHHTDQQNISIGKKEEFELLQLLTELLKDKKIKEEYPVTSAQTNAFDDLLLFDMVDTQNTTLPLLEEKIASLITKAANSNASIYVLDRENVCEYIKIHHLESLIHELTPADLKNNLTTAKILGLSHEKTKDYIRNTHSMSISTDDLPTIEF